MIIKKNQIPDDHTQRWFSKKLKIKLKYLPKNTGSLPGSFTKPDGF